MYVLQHSLVPGGRFFRNVFRIFPPKSGFVAPLYHLVGYGAAAATGGGGGRGLIFMLPPLPPREDTEKGNGITGVILGDFRQMVIT